MIEWDGFKGTKWQKSIDVDSFIEDNYSEYTGDESFLKGISKSTSKVWKKCQKLLAKESISGVLDVETYIMSGIDNFEPGYIDRSNEVIVGLQTDEPLKRIVNPYGGYRMVKKSLEAYGFHLEKELELLNIDKAEKEWEKASQEHIEYVKKLKQKYGKEVINGLDLTFEEHKKWIELYNKENETYRKIEKLQEEQEHRLKKKVGGK